MNLNYRASGINAQADLIRQPLYKIITKIFSINLKAEAKARATIKSTEENPSRKMNKERINELDLLRFLAAITVVFFIIPSGAMHMEALLIQVIHGSHRRASMVI